MENENLNQLPEDTGVEETYQDTPEPIEDVKEEEESVVEESVPGVPESEREVSELPEEKGEETKLELPEDSGEVSEYEDIAEPDLSENSEDLDEFEEDEGVFDLSACELDTRGVPVLSVKDLDNITYYSSFVGMPPEQMMGNIRNLYKEIDEYFEYMALPEDQRDPALAYIYNEENFKSTIEVLGKFQLEARSQNLNELDTASFTSMIENANVSQLFLTSLCVNDIFNKENNDNDILDKDLSIEDNLKNENYYTIFVKELRNKIHSSDIIDKPDKILSNESYDRNIKKFNEIYQLMFNHIGYRYAYNANSQTNKILDSIFNIVIEYWNRITRYAYMNDPEYRVAYSKMIAKESNVPDDKLDEYINDKMQKIEEILKKDFLYYSLKNHSDEGKLVDKSIQLSKKMYDLAEKLSKDFSNKEYFMNYLKENCLSLDKFLNLVYEKYGIELKKEPVEIENAMPENENTETKEKEQEKSPLSQLEEIISTEIRKYEIASDKKTNFDLDEIERSVDGALTNKVEDASSEFDKYQKMQEEKAGPQAKRDKYSARNYPFLESAKYATGSLKNIISYVSNSSKINYAMQLLNEIISNYITTEIYKVLDQSGIMRRDHSDFLVSNIDLKTPIKDLDEKVFDESRRNNPYKSISSKYQTDICGAYLDELSACITVTETCSESDEMLKDICLYYGVNESSVSSFEQIRSLDLFYRHNNINQIRYTVFDNILSIYDKLICDIDLIISENNDVLKNRMMELIKMEEEREKLIQERQRLKQNKKNRKKRK